MLIALVTRLDEEARNRKQRYVTYSTLRLSFTFTRLALVDVDDAELEPAVVGTRVFEHVDTADEAADSR